MKIIKNGETKVIMSNPHGKANYFGWPSAARLQNGKIAVVASGYRYAHICPFGKAVISYSEDNGETYTAPAPIIDTPLDDRDAGILPFGEKSVIVTSFNNALEFQRNSGMLREARGEQYSKFAMNYIDTTTPEEEEKYIGSEFRISNDFGITFGEIHKSPITSPHGPCELNDGTLLWVGRTFDKLDNSKKPNDEIRAYKINSDGSMEYLSSIENIPNHLSCEPHAIQLKDGTIICHIRVQENDLFTTFQTESKDGGLSWTTPKQLLDDKGGAPAQLLLHSSGALISTYGYREEPYGIKAMVSRDNGKTWEKGQYIYENTVGWDLGYPCTVELPDGDLLTVFYAHEEEGGPAVIMQQKWRLENED